MGDESRALGGRRIRETRAKIHGLDIRSTWRRTAATIGRTRVHSWPTSRHSSKGLGGQLYALWPWSHLTPQVAPFVRRLPAKAIPSALHLDYPHPIPCCSTAT